MCESCCKGEKSVLVNKLFDSIAPVYDLLNAIISAGMHKNWKNVAVSQLEVDSNLKVLDLCCGSGDITQLILDKKQDDMVIYAVDFSNNMLDIARKRFEDRQNVIILHGDARQLPFDDDFFDRVIISFGLRNLDNIENALKEINRVLRKDGVFVNIDFGKPCVPFFSLLFNVYFSLIVPILGMLFKKHKEYAYLIGSIREFPHPDRIIAIMENIGFCKCVNLNLFLGFVAVQKGSKH